MLINLLNYKKIIPLSTFLLFLPKNIMKKFTTFLIAISFVFLFSQCKKEETSSWSPCVNCDISAWEGTFDGTGVYFQELDSTSQNDVATTVSIENTSGTMLKVKIDSDNLFSSTTMVSKTDNSNVIALAGSNSSISLTLTKKDNDLRISGTSKKYHLNIDTVLVIDYSLSFDVIKLK